MDYFGERLSPRRRGSSTRRWPASPGSASAKTTLDDVAREAGCARATVYRCFPGTQRAAPALCSTARSTALARAGRRRGRRGRDARRRDRRRDPHRAPSRSARTRRSRSCSRTSPRSSPPQLSFERGSALLHHGGRARRARVHALPRRPTGAERLGEWVARLTLLVPLQSVRAGAPRRPRATCARSSSTSCCPASLEPSTIRIRCRRRRSFAMTTNIELIGRDEINDLEAILSVCNTDVERDRAHGQGERRRGLHVGLRAQPHAAHQALREGQDVAVERHDRPRLVDRRSTR